MKNAKQKHMKWLRRLSGLITTMMLTMSFSSHASARILFQDDTFHDIASEGLIINFDDGGDEDVTFQFGNDGTDGTIIWDDGASTLTIGDGTDSIAVNSDSWDISSAGVGSGFTGFTSTGVVDFTGASRFAIHQGAANPGTCTEGDMFYNTTDNTTYICTATNTWTAFSTGGADTFESVYSADGDNTLTTTNGDFTINSGTGDTIITSNDWSVNAAGVITGTSVTDGTATLTGGSLNGLTGGDATTENTIEGFIFDADAENISGVWEVQDNTAFNFGNDADVSILYDETTDNRLEITGANADVYIEDDLIVDTDATVNGTLDANGVVTLGDGGDSITINSSTWDISSAGAASGFTTFTGSGNITTSGGDFIIGTTGLTETTANNDSGAFLIGIFDEFDNSNGGNVQDVIDDIDAAIGARTYTEDNVLTDGQTVTASLDALDLKWGDLASTTNGEGASLVGVEDAGGYFTATNVETIFAEIGASIGSNAPNVEELTFEPEYPNVVVFEDGSSNKGKLEALYDGTNREHYYRWTTKKNASNDIDLRLRYELPADFAATGNLTIRRRTDTNVLANNSVAVLVRNDTDNATCHTDAAAPAAVAGTWETITITAGEIGTGCAGGNALTAGDTVEVQIKLAADDTASGGTDVGTLAHDYTN